MKKRIFFSNGGVRDYLLGLFQRWSGEKNLPTNFLNPVRPTTKSWIVFIPGTAGLVMSPVQARPFKMSDNPLGCK